MFTPLVGCHTPKPSTAIWRYLDFAKFVALLQSQSLWFTCLEELRKMDPYEGAWPDVAKVAFKAAVASNPSAYTAFGTTPSEILSNARESVRRLYFVNCWHMNKGESAAMWKLYSGTGGLAIVSSVARLTNALSIANRPFHIARVEYADIPNHPSDSITEACFRKRPSFQHERELRVAIVSMDETRPPGHAVPIELLALMKRVVISPEAPPWLERVVRTELQQYGLSGVEVTPSWLYNRTLR